LKGNYTKQDKLIHNETYTMMQLPTSDNISAVFEDGKGLITN